MHKLIKYSVNFYEILHMLFCKSVSIYTVLFKETHAIYIKISLSFVSTLVIATAVKTISGEYVFI